MPGVHAEASSEKTLILDDHFRRPFLFISVEGKFQNQKERNHSYEKANSYQ